MKKDKSKNKVVILGGGINALGIIRSFQKTDIPLVAMSWYKDYGMSSRYCTSVICPNPLKEDQLIDFLMDYGSKLSKKAVLFATSDLFLMPVIEHKQKLEKYFHIPVCDWKILKKLIKKEFLYEYASQLGIPCPKTEVVFQKEELDNINTKIPLPIIVKPSVNINFSAKLGSKAFIVKSLEEYNELISKIKETDLYKEGLIFQEYIPGDTTSLYTITSYADKNSDIRAYSIGHKIRQYPPQTGTIISGKVTHVEDILIHAKEFIKSTKFFGISNIEFKKDDRDGSYKLMEINPRTGVWNLSALEAGVNMPLMAYNDALELSFSDEENKEKELIWLITPLDFYFALWGFAKKGFPDFKISFKEWQKSVKGKKLDACFKWNDPMPFIKGLFMKFK